MELSQGLPSTLNFSRPLCNHTQMNISRSLNPEYFLSPSVKSLQNLSLAYHLCENIIPCLITYSITLFSPHLSWSLGNPTIGSRELGPSLEVWEECMQTDHHPASAAGVGVDSHCWSSRISLCEENIDPSTACVSLASLGDLEPRSGMTSWHCHF